MYRTAALAVVGVALALGLPARVAQGANLYWDSDGSAIGNNITTGQNLGGSGMWETPNRWFDPAAGGGAGAEVAWSAGSDAVFIGTPGTVTLGAAQSASSLAFKSNGYLITGSSLNMGTGTDANYSVDPGVTATVGSVIGGSATMVKLGGGTLVLTGSNVNTAITSGGGWRIEGGGTLRINGDTSLGAPLPDTARNTVTDIQLNQSTLNFAAPTEININRRTKVNTNSSTNLGDAVIDVTQYTVSWFGSIQGGPGTLRVTGNNNGGMLILGTDKIASINPFGSVLPGGTVNLTVENHVVVQTSGTVTPTGGELGSETGAGGAVLAIKLQTSGQIRSESGGYTFQRNLILGPGGGSLDTGAWIQTFAGGTVSGPGSLTKFGTGTLVIDNPSASWAGGTFVRDGTLQLGQGGSNGLLPGTLASPSSVVIDAGGTLKFLRGSNKSFFDIISGPGKLTVANGNNATVRLVSDNTYTGLTTITSGILMIGQGNPGEPGSIASNVLDNATLVFNKVEDLTYAGAISGTGAVTKQAAGTLKLTGASTYTGATTVSKGRLLVAGALGRTAVSVAGGASLTGTGSIAGSVIVAGGNTAAGQGILDLRDGAIGTLFLTDANSADTVLTIGAAAADSPSILGFDVAATADAIQLSAGKLLVNPGGGIVNITPRSGFGPGTYDLLEFPSGQASGLSGLVLSTTGLPSGFEYRLQSTPNAEQLVVAVPEPAAGLALVGIGAVCIVGRRRRRAPGKIG